MPDFAADAPEFRIDELDGQERTVILTARALPYPPYTLAGTQKVEVTYLAGNPIATPDVTGPEEENTEINGFWKDKFLGLGAGETPIVVNGVAVRTTREITQIMDSIRREGQLLAVTWDIHVRHGFLERFEQKWRNVHDCEWTMRFKWISQGDDPLPAVISATPNLSDLQFGLQQELNVFDAAKLPFIPAALDWIANVQALGTQLTSQVESITGAASSVASTALLPFDAARRCISACSSVINIVKEGIEDIDSRVAFSINMGEGTSGFLAQGLLQQAISGLGTQGQGQVITDGRDLPMDRLSIGERMQTYDYTYGIRRSLRSQQSIAVTNRSNLLGKAQTNILGTYTAREGDDLRDVSEIFYGTPFNWRQIMQFNDLDTAELDVGQLVLVPKMTTGGA